MADRKISDLTALTTPAAGDYLPIIDISEPLAANKNKRITIEELLRGAPDGTAGAPGFAFESDPDSGLYSTGANGVALSTGGTGRLFVDASGNVAAPVAIQIGNASALGALGVRAVTNGNLYVRDINSLTAGTGVALDVLNDSLTAVQDLAIRGATTIFRNGTSETLRITSAGLVGIGSSAPQAELNVAKTGGASTVYIESDAGNNATTSILRFGGASGRSASIQGFRGASSNIHSLDFYTYNSGDSFGMRLTPTGLGIGTTSPGDTLHVSGSIRADVDLKTINQGKLNLGSNHGGGAVLLYNTNGNLDIAPRSGFSTTFLASDGGTERARIDSDGRLLVGASSGSGNAKIQLEGGTIYGDAYLDLCFKGSVASGQTLGELRFTDEAASANVYAKIAANADGTPGAGDYPGRLVFSTTADGASSPTERMRIRSTGAISMSSGLVIGGTGDPGSSFYITSDVITSGAGNSTLKYNSTSGLVTYDTSSRLVKENIEECPYGIDDLKQLKPRKYLRIDDQRTEIGFIADEVIDLMPEFVPVGAKSIITKNASDTELIPLGVNYEKLTAVLTKALQEAIAKIETLEAKVAALEGA